MPKPPTMQRRSREQSGQAFVELALVLPVLLLLLLGVVQFGTVFRDYIALTDATRVGARQAAVSRSIQPDVESNPARRREGADGCGQPRSQQDDGDGRRR